MPKKSFSVLYFYFLCHCIYTITVSTETPTEDGVACENIIMSSAHYITIQLSLFYEGMLEYMKHFSFSKVLFISDSNNNNIFAKHVYK
jgi:hypothetical protein